MLNGVLNRMEVQISQNTGGVGDGKALIDGEMF